MDVEMDKIGHLLNGSGLQEKREGGKEKVPDVILR